MKADHGNYKVAILYKDKIIGERKINE